MKKGGTAPLYDFMNRYPGSPQAAQAKVAVHKIYADAFDYYVQHRQSPPAARSFIGAMLASCEERNDPFVVLDITTGDMKPVIAADEAEAGTNYEKAAPRLSGVGRGVYIVFEAWLSNAFPKGVLQTVSAEANPDKNRPVFKIVVIPVVSGTLVSEREGFRFTNVRFRVEFHAAVPKRHEQVNWNATTVGLTSFDVAVKADVFNDSRTDRAALTAEVYARMFDQVDPVFHAQMKQHF
jgi:hypothetical protein